MPSKSVLMLDEETRAALWKRLIEAVESYASKIDSHPVTAELDPEKIRALLKPLNFAKPQRPIEALDLAVESLWKYQTHTPHPRYFGLFNPAPTTMGIAADMLVAAFNPQLAAWSHSPFAIEVEQHLVRCFGERFGYDPNLTDGTFASGGAEANHTALLTALIDSFPQFSDKGLRSLEGQPVFYVSSESHHSFLKAARLTGLGTDAVREIEVDDKLQMNVDALQKRIETDRSDGFIPFMAVATAGTTNAGIVDPIASIAEISEREKLWLHVDAAWGGAAAFVPALSRVLDGIERADSITFDAHKWLSVPMGAGIYITRHKDLLDRTFRIANNYMPREAAGLDVVDSYAHCMQWSRRFIGLKVFLSLLAAGWEGYEAAIKHQTAMGDRLRDELYKSGWKIVNETALPVVCFVDGEHPSGDTASHLDSILNKALSSGDVWISMTQIGRGKPVLRACITNYRTGPEDVDALVEALNRARI